MVKRLGIFTIVTVIILSLITACTPKNTVATVNGENISKSEYQKMLDSQVSSIEANYGPQDWSQKVQGKTLGDQVKDGVLESLIMEKIQLQQAKKEKISVSDKEVNNEVNNKIKLYESYVGGKDKLDALLKQQKTDRSKFISDLKNGTKINLTIQKLQDKGTKNIKVSDADVKKYYDTHTKEFKPDTVTASHILVKDKKTADEIEQKLKSGQKFETLAKEYSIDPSSKDKGGDLGTFTYGNMIPEVENAAFAMKPGEISQPIKSQYGYHIIKVTAKKIVPEKPFDQVKGDISKKLLTTKKSDAYNKLVDKWRKSAKVKKYQSVINSVKLPSQK